MPKSSSIKFTVIIPTRSRPDTLRWSLKSCVEQNYDDLEIIVSDNFSEDETINVVNSYGDSRIKYVNPQRRLGMAEHWEFALGHATGDYVNYIGDDDAMMPRAFSSIEKILREYDCAALTWIKDDFVYNWPRADNSNLLSISLWGDAGVKVIDSRELLRGIQSFKVSYTQSPMIYSGTIKRSLLEQIAKQGQGFFNAPSPDVYSGIAVASTIDRFHRSGTPFSMTGCSSHSIGASTLGPQPVNPSASVQFFQENTLATHPQLEVDPVNAAMCVAESVLIARDLLPQARALQIDFGDLLETIAKDSQHFTADRYHKSVVAIRRIGALNNIPEQAERLLRKYPNHPRESPINKFINKANNIGTVAYLNCQDFGISNVYAASVLADHVLSMHRGGCFSWRYKVNKFLSSLVRS